MTSKKKPVERRKRVKQGVDSQEGLKSIRDEVRAIRGEKGKDMPDRGHDRGKSRTRHGLACAYCGEVGEHACYPTIMAALEASPDYAQACWEILKEMERVGLFEIEEDTGPAQTITLEGLFE